MPFSRYPQWRQRGSQLLTVECLPDETACITADGQISSRSEVLNLILAGRDRWNTFRASLPHLQWYRGPVMLPGFVLRLNRADFRKRDLSEYDLTGCEFRSCNFGRVKFKRSNLAGTGPHGTYERPAAFVDCNLRSTVFEGSRLNGCNFETQTFLMRN